MDQKTTAEDLLARIQQIKQAENFRIYPQEIKDEVIDLLQTHGIQKVNEMTGIAKSTISAWKKEYLENDNSQFNPEEEIDFCVTKISPTNDSCTFEKTDDIAIIMKDGINIRIFDQLAFESVIQKIFL